LNRAGLSRPFSGAFPLSAGLAKDADRVNAAGPILGEVWFHKVIPVVEYLDDPPFFPGIRAQLRNGDKPSSFHRYIFTINKYVKNID
jgi:hypothetical protein